MIIRKVELENFISHKRTIVELEPGITVIVGPNGAGKTSIIDAITFALFKEHTRGGKLVNLINRGSSRARVKLTFNVNGIDYVIERTIVRETPQTARQLEVHLYKYTDKGPVLIARGDRKVNEELQRILGVSPKTYTLSVFVKQGEIENLITTTPAERKKAIGELLGLNKLEKAYEKIKDVINYWSMKATIIGAEASKLKEREQRLRQLEEHCHRLGLDLKEKKEELKRIEEELERIERKVKELEEKRDKSIRLELRLKPLEREIEYLEKEKSRLEKEIREAQEARTLLEKTAHEVRRLQAIEKGVEALRRLEDLEDPEKQLDSLLEELSRLKERKERLEGKASRYVELREKAEILQEELRRIEPKVREKEKLQASINEILQQENRIRQKIKMMIGDQEPEKHLNMLEESTRQLDEEVEAYNEVLKGIEAEIKAYQVRIRELEERIRNLKNISGEKCPTCGQPLPEELRSKIIAELEGTKEKLVNRVEELEEERSDIKQRLSKAQRVLEEQRSMTIRLRHLIEDLKIVMGRRKALEEKLRLIQQYAEDYEETRKKLDEILREKNQLEKDYQELLALEARMRELHRRREELIERVMRARRLKEIIRSVEEETGIPQQLFYEAKKRLDQLRIEMKALEERAKELPKLSESLEQMLRKLEEARRQYNEIKALLRKLSFSEEEYRRLRGLVENLRSRQRKLVEETSRIEGALKRVEEELVRAREEYEKARKAKEEKERLDKLIGVLREIRELYSKDGLQKIVRAYAKRLIEYYAKDIVARFNLNISDISLDEDFNITVITPLGEQPVDTISGGERVAVAIALRLALAKALVGKGVESIILDEPTIHLDEERRRELVGILRSSFQGVREIVSQLVIVTHDRELEDAADTVYQVTRVNDYSRVTKIA